MSTNGVGRRRSMRLLPSLAALLLVLALTRLLLYPSWHSIKQTAEYLSTKHWHLHDLTLSPDGETLVLAVRQYDGTDTVATRLVAMNTRDWSTKWAYGHPVVLLPQGWSPAGGGLLTKLSQPASRPGVSGFFWLEQPGPDLATEVVLPDQILGIVNLMTPITRDSFVIQVLSLPGSLPSQVIYLLQTERRPSLRLLTSESSYAELLAIRPDPASSGYLVYFSETEVAEALRGPSLQVASTLGGQAKELLSAGQGGWLHYTLSRTCKLVARANFHRPYQPAAEPPMLQVLGGSPMDEIASHQLPWYAQVLCWSHDGSGVLAMGDGVGFWSLASGAFRMITLLEPVEQPARLGSYRTGAVALRAPDHFVLLRRDRLWLIDAKQGTGRILMDARPLDTGEPASPGPL